MSHFNTSSGDGAKTAGASAPSPTYGTEDSQQHPSDANHEGDSSRGFKGDLMNRIANHFLKGSQQMPNQAGHPPHMSGAPMTYGQNLNAPNSHPVNGAGMGYGYPPNQGGYGVPNNNMMYGSNPATQAPTGHSGASGMLSSLLHGSAGGQQQANYGPTYGTNYNNPSNMHSTLGGGGGYGMQHGGSGGLAGNLISMIMSNPQLRNTLIQMVMLQMSGKPGKQGKYKKSKKRGIDDDGADDADDLEAQRQLFEGMSTEELVNNPDIQKAFGEMQAQSPAAL